MSNVVAEEVRSKLTPRLLKIEANSPRQHADVVAM
jgi:hypothetical protein